MRSLTPWLWTGVVVFSFFALVGELITSSESRKMMGEATRDTIRYIRMTWRR